MGIRMKEVKAKVFLNLVVTLLLVGVALFAINALLPRILSTQIPLAVVSSYSMEPVLHVGDLLVIVGVKPSDIKVGDIIVYRGYREPIVHRVIKVGIVNGVYRFLTKGDANAYPDQNARDPTSWVGEEEVLGKVVIVVPYLGSISLALTKNRTLYYIVIAGLVLLLIISVIPRRRVFK